MANTYYPALSSILSTEYLPEKLNFITTGINDLFDNVYFKDLIVEKSLDGVATTYRVDIVSYSKILRLEIPGTGLVFILNPDLQNPNINYSTIPISLTWSWGIKKYFKNFKLNTFSFSADAFYKMIFQIADISDQDLLLSLLDSPIEYLDALDEFVVNTNNQYPTLNIPYPINPNQEIALQDTLLAFSQSSTVSFYSIVFQDYIFNVNNIDEAIDKISKLFSNQLGDDVVASIKELFVPQISASVHLSAGLEIPRSVLIPLKINGEIETDEAIKTTLLFDAGEFTFNTKGGFGFDEIMSLSFPPAHPTAQIGNTGLIIGFTKAKLDFSRTKNIPEADVAGYPLDFIGLYVEKATIGFNRFGSDDTDRTSAAIVGENLLIGTGGISGIVALESNGVLYRKFGNFSVELNTFALTFKFGSIVATDIAGKITLGKFTQNGQPAVINVIAHISDNGDFTVTAKPDAGYYTISLAKVLDIHVRSLELGREARGFYAEISGKLDFTAEVPGLGKVLPTNIEIEKFRIWDNGDIEFKGGSFTIPKAFKLRVGPVNLEVSNISFGSYSRQHNGIERKYRFFGFDGMINTGRAGVNATGNGIKYYFTVDNNDTDKPFDSFTSIDGIGIDLTIPGDVSKEKAAFILNGYLRMKNPDPAIVGSNAGSEYTGAISFSMPKMGLAGSAGMRLQPSRPSFIVDIGLELPGPIPLGATGLGIYGFRGLIGQHYKAAKSATTPPLPDDASWWEYYKAKSTITHREGIELDKFADQPGYSVGAGASIATVFDKGFTFSTKLFLYLGLPGVFMLQGQAGVLRKRIGLTQDVDPPFSALIVIDNKSFMANLAVNYRLPEGGAFDGFIFSLQGALELAFFFNNSSGWYLNVGKDQPESARIRAKILTIFQGYAYLMISSRGIKAGAGARFDFKIDWKIVKLGFGAFLDLGGSISFKPIQIGGFIKMGGYAYIQILRFKLSLSITITLAFEAPHPFIIYGSLELDLGLPWPIRKLGRIKLELKWEINSDNSPLLAPIPVLSLPEPSSGYMPAAATNILSNETFPINYVEYEMVGDSINIPAPGAGGWKYNFKDETAAMQVTVPLDSFIDIDLLKPVKPGAFKIGGASSQLPDGYKELLPPQKGLSTQVRHELELAGLEVYAWKANGAGGSWQPYNIYEAVTAIVAENKGAASVDLSKLNNGYWQFNEPNRYNKIRLLAQNMFSYSNDLSNAASDLDALNFNRKDLFCYESILKQSFINWISEPVGKLYPTGQTAFVKGVPITLLGMEATVKYNSTFGNNSLYISDSQGKIAFTFAFPISYLKFEFGENNNEITIDFVKYGFSISRLGLTNRREALISTRLIADSEQQAVVEYNDLANPITKIYITIKNKNVLDFDSDLVLGGHFPLPDNLIIPSPYIELLHSYETEKALIFAALYNRTVSAIEVVQYDFNATAGKVGQWNMDTYFDSIGTNPSVISGSLDQTAGFYTKTAGNEFQLHQSYSFLGNNDSLIVPYAPELKVETGSFAIGVTAVFDPFTAGISTLVHKVNTDSQSGNRKGFAIHLYKSRPLDAAATYQNSTEIPAFDIWFTAYDKLNHSGIKASAKFTLDCASSKLTTKQYKQVLVSVNRENGFVEIYIDRILCATAAIPAELNLTVVDETLTVLNQVSYQTESVQRRQEDNEINMAGFIDETEILSDNLNNVIQPIWRPNTTFAVLVKTRDVVNGNRSTVKNYVYGFQTAGPIGHFQQKSAIYKALEAEDRVAESKLAGLKYYIDYERSFPDAQSRYDLSKPVLCHDPKLALLFNKPYINAMFANWDNYLGLNAVSSKLELQLLDPYGAVLDPELIWETLPDIEINDANYKRLSPDQQRLYLLNKAALEDSCNVNPISIKKRKKQGTFHFPDLLPNRLYTALFTAVYQPQGEKVQRSEVHRFNFKTSRWATFEDQAASFILNKTAGEEQYAIYKISTAFSSATIENSLKNLIDDEEANDPIAASRFAVQYDRIVYGGLGIKNPEPIEYSKIQVVVNADPDDISVIRILGIIISNPEPFNNPKLSKELLADTVGLTLTTSNGVLDSEAFKYFHSRDTSAVFITNPAMDLPIGTMTLYFKQRLFSGDDYTTEYVEYTSQALPLSK